MKSEKSKKKKLSGSKIIGLALSTFCLLVACIFVFLLIKVAIIPEKYLLFGIVVLAIICIYNIVSQFTSIHLLGKILSVILSIVMILSSLYLNKTINIIGAVSGNTSESAGYSIVVRSADTAASVNDISNYTFSYVSGLDDDGVNTVLTTITNETGTAVKSQSLDNWSQLVSSADSANVALVINEAYRDILDEQSDGFSSKTKVLKTYTINIPSETAVSNKDVSSDVFTVYIAGSDKEGSIGSTGNSDVNIIASVNPETHQILLVTTPGNAYVPIDETSYDKLSCAGLYGVTSSMSVMSKLYNVDIDYYVKTNLTGLTGIIDALGGITINSNTYDGAKALAFCREDTTATLGKNQLAVVASIFNKATSPAIILNYMSVLDSVTNFIVTNMPQDAITSFVKSILNDQLPWNIQMFSAELGSSKSFGFSKNLFSNQEFTDINTDTIQLVHDLIKMNENGESIDVNIYTN